MLELLLLLGHTTHVIIRAWDIIVDVDILYVVNVDASDGAIAH